MTTTSEPLQLPLYEGYRIVPVLARELASDGNVSITCVLTATEVADLPARMIFARTLELTQAQAAITNQLHPGSVPPPEQLDAELIGIGVGYMQALIDLVNGGFRSLAPLATHSPSEVRSRLGMTRTALQRREQ